MVILALVSLLTQQPPLVHCSLARAQETWRGSCTELAGETPTLTLKQASSMTTGRYRSDEAPTSMFAGEERIASGGATAVELEIYESGTGILRAEGLVWLPVSHVTAAADSLTFDLDPSKTVPPSDLDREIVKRAAAILSSEAVWDRADDRKCEATDKTWSIYCAMTRATQEVTGGVHHRRPAMEVVRVIVEERTAGRNYNHRLMDYNNDSTTTLADVKSLFAEALKRMPVSGR